MRAGQAMGRDEELAACSDTTRRGGGDSSNKVFKHNDGTHSVDKRKRESSTLCLYNELMNGTVAQKAQCTAT